MTPMRLRIGHLLFIPLCAAALTSPALADAPRFIKGELIVKYKEAAAPAAKSFSTGRQAFTASASSLRSIDTLHQRFGVRGAQQIAGNVVQLRGSKSGKALLSAPDRQGLDRI